MVKKRAGKVSLPQVDDTPKEEETAKGDKRIMTTLAEYGASLPIGVLVGETLDKTIEVKTWKTKDERAMGDMLSQSASMADHVSVVVANMCSRLGPYDLTSMSDDEKSLKIKMMYVGDVFYAYAYLRRQTMGSKLDLDITCPRPGCGVQFPYTGMIDTIEVATVDNPDDILWQYTLEDPIEIRNKLKVTHFQVAYPKWHVMEVAGQGANETEVKVATIQGAVIGVNDSPDSISLLPHEVDEISKRDLEGLAEGINKHYLGPKMGIEGKCSKSVCTRYKSGGFSFAFPINWSYKDFFGASSR